MSATRAISAALVALALSSPAVGHAQRAGAALLERHAELERICDRGGADRERALGRLVDDSLDYEAITERLLVVHWAGLDTAQRREAHELVEELIRARYLRHVERLRGYSIRVESEDPRPAGVRVVSVADRVDVHHRIAYDMVRRAGRYRVVDIIVDGESMLSQTRQQFDRVIRREGWNGFIARLRQKLEEERG